MLREAVYKVSTREYDKKSPDNNNKIYIYFVFYLILKYVYLTVIIVFPATLYIFCVYIQ